MQIGTLNTSSSVAPLVENAPAILIVEREKSSFFKREQSEQIYAGWKVGKQIGYTTASDAMRAAKTFSQGEMPAVIVIKKDDRFELRGLGHRNTQETRYSSRTWYTKFDQQDAAQAVRIQSLNTNIVGLVDDSWSFTFTADQPSVKPN